MSLLISIVIYAVGFVSGIVIMALCVASGRNEPIDELER